MARETLSDVTEQLKEQNGLLEKVSSQFSDFFDRQARDKLDLLEMVREQLGSGSPQENKDRQGQQERDKEKDGISFMDGLFGTILKAGMFAGFGTLLYNSFRDELGLPSLGDLMEGTFDKVSRMMIRAANTMMPEELQIDEGLTPGEIGAGVVGAKAATVAAGAGVRSISRTMQAQKIQKTIKEAVEQSKPPSAPATPPPPPEPPKIKASDIELTGKDALDSKGKPLKGAAANSRKQSIANKINSGKAFDKAYEPTLEKYRKAYEQDRLARERARATVPDKPVSTTKGTSKVVKGAGAAGLVVGVVAPLVADTVKESTGVEKGSFTDAAIDIGLSGISGASMGATAGLANPVLAIPGALLGGAAGLGYGVYDKLFKSPEKLESLTAEQKGLMIMDLDQASMDAAQSEGSSTVIVEGDKNTNSNVQQTTVMPGKNDIPSPTPFNPYSAGNAYLY